MTAKLRVGIVEAAKFGAITTPGSVVWDIMGVHIHANVYVTTRKWDH